MSEIDRITPTHGDLSEVGDIAVCAFCLHSSASGEHVWMHEEDTPGAWVCEDETDCSSRTINASLGL